MFEELTQVKSVDEIKSVFLNESEDFFFTDNELKHAEQKNKIKSLGARYLIKKSILDYLSFENGFKDIEIINQKNGKPIVELMGRVLKEMKELEISNIQISISHSRGFITSLVILEKDV
jgi:phosphopantetheine--protein transferase-like protein